MLVEALTAVSFNTANPWQFLQVEMQVISCSWPYTFSDRRQSVTYRRLNTVPANFSTANLFVQRSFLRTCSDYFAKFSCFSYIGVCYPLVAGKTYVGWRKCFRIIKGYSCRTHSHVHVLSIFIDWGICEKCLVLWSIIIIVLIMQWKHLCMKAFWWPSYSRSGSFNSSSNNDT